MAYKKILLFISDNKGIITVVLTTLIIILQFNINKINQDYNEAIVTAIKLTNTNVINTQYTTLQSQAYLDLIRQNCLNCENFPDSDRDSEELKDKINELHNEVDKNIELNNEIKSDLKSVLYTIENKNKDIIPELLFLILSLLIIIINVLDFQKIINKKSRS